MIAPNVPTSKLPWTEFEVLQLNKKIAFECESNIIYFQKKRYSKLWKLSG